MTAGGQQHVARHNIHPLPGIPTLRQLGPKGIAAKTEHHEFPRFASRYCPHRYQTWHYTFGSASDLSGKSSMNSVGPSFNVAPHCPT
jgi:hypothetical protein